MKKLAVGILAHVDAGKTTLSEAMLYQCGSIRKLGRVDHKNSFLDADDIERERGITIFSKQAQLVTDSMSMCLLDTPGHVDFSSETERTLQVLDAAVLVISGTDGVQAHTETLWKLLRLHGIPTFIFVTKMDIRSCSRDTLLKDLQVHLSENCLCFDGDKEALYESLAMCDETVLDRYMETGVVPDDDIAALVGKCAVFPVLFGSGLKNEGVDSLISAVEKFMPEPQRPDDFGARVYKILRDSKNNRLSCMKIIGGTLKNRQIIKCGDVEEKVTGIRIYSGNKFTAVEQAQAGDICAVQGLAGSYPGQGLGFEADSELPQLEPVLVYKVRLSPGTDAQTALKKLKELEDEDPMLRIMWSEQTQEINIQLMGEIQTQVLTRIIHDRFDMDVSMDSGSILYRETIASAVEGVGHFEPLRHYAEVHLALEPGKDGSGLAFASCVSEDELDRNWQNLILTHLSEKQHIGVLTGSPITDMKISLIAGRAHPKHTEGGDFRQAVYRALRQGLMKADSVLLEPWYSFSLEVPAENTGRAISDLRMLYAEFKAPEEMGGICRICGEGPVSELNGYAAEVLSYTGGRGRFFCRLSGYKLCHNSQQVIDRIGYKPEADTANTADSVFCSHGAGVSVKWNETEKYMHIDTKFGRDKNEMPAAVHRHVSIDDEELEAIMTREFGPVKRREYGSTKPREEREPKYSAAKREYLIIDGYNVIFAWDELSALAEDNLALARERLVDMLRSYRGFKDCELVLVFDGYKVKGSFGEKADFGKVHVVYTKEGETGDMYIEKLADEIGLNYAVKVVTNDSLIRLSALRSGVLRMSSAEFVNELKFTLKQISEYTEHGK